MKAMVHDYGTPDVLPCEEVEMPFPKEKPEHSIRPDRSERWGYA